MHQQKKNASRRSHTSGVSRYVRHIQLRYMRRNSMQNRTCAHCDYNLIVDLVLIWTVISNVIWTVIRTIL